MKVGIFFESYTNAGGGFYLSQSKFNLLIKTLNSKFEYECFVTTKSTEQYLNKHGKYKFTLFELTLYKKILFFIFSIFFFKKIFNFFEIKNPLEKVLVDHKIDLLFFVSPSSFVRFCENTNFVYNIWEMQHKSISYFPEYSGKRYGPNLYRIREDSYKYAVDKAFKIIVDSKRTIRDINNSYNQARDDLFEMQAFVPILPDYYEKIKNNENFNKIFESLNLPKKKILFYPAQFWPHKNHIYLIKSFEKMLEKKFDDFILIFSGHDKGNKKYIVDQINQRKLNKNIIIFEYLSLEQVISLYLNSTALVMTSLVGRTSLPLREAFYFRLPVFYSGKILDENYANFVNELDLENFSHLYSYLSDKNNSLDPKKTSLAYDFYKKTCSENVIKESYEKILNQYIHKSEYWKK